MNPEMQTTARSFESRGMGMHLMSFVGALSVPIIIIAAIVAGASMWQRPRPQSQPVDQWVMAAGLGHGCLGWMCVDPPPPHLDLAMWLGGT